MLLPISMSMWSIEPIELIEPIVLVAVAIAVLVAVLVMDSIGIDMPDMPDMAVDIELKDVKLVRFCVRTVQQACLIGSEGKANYKSCTDHFSSV